MYPCPVLSHWILVFSFSSFLLSVGASARCGFSVRCSLITDYRWVFALFMCSITGSFHILIGCCCKEKP
ncbi:hypothetical protein L1887_08555 [Cichorium endivia]|nr:hypothetical protein L1887_08555 [Cichorium endivia]